VEDVARVAGVSPITVSRALRTPDLVRPETRLRVTEAVERTGYVVNPIASSLRSGRSSIVTVFVSSLRNPHFASAMQGAIDAFEGSRFHLMFAQTGYSERMSPQAVDAMLPFRPAGLVFTGVVRSEETRKSLRRLGVPVVEMWGQTDDPIDMLVASSTFEGGRLMGEHFAKQGFRRIAYCGTTLERGSERLAGFRAGLAESGLEPAHVMPMEGTRSFADGMAAVREIMTSAPDCDAISSAPTCSPSGRSLRRAIAASTSPSGWRLQGSAILILRARSIRPSPRCGYRITSSAGSPGRCCSGGSMAKRLINLSYKFRLGLCRELRPPADPEKFRTSQRAKPLSF